MTESGWLTKFDNYLENYLKIVRVSKYFSEILHL